MSTSADEQYIVDENGNPTAVILSIESYRKILAIMDEIEDQKETKILSQSEEFKKLVKKGLEDVKLDRIKPWKEVWDEL
jgi:PHD/YefM family antitoxin component YafN of YafNO toxin-antitoxin module